MANKIINSRVVMKHDTSANWALATNFVPLNGEFIVYTDVNKFKIGDGVTTVINLPFSSADDMVGATESAAGVHGLVPAPAAGEQGKFLRGDGTWQPAETVIEVNELPAYATANQKAIYRVPEMTADVYDWVGTTVPNSGTVSSLFINSDNLIPSYMSDRVTLQQNMAYVMAAATHEGVDVYMGLLDYGAMIGAPYPMWCLVKGQGTALDFIYDYDGEWDTELLNETIDFFKGKQLLTSVTTPYGVMPVGEDNANITGFFSTTEPTYQIVDPAHAINYKYYIANELGWQNINNQIINSSKAVAIPEDTTINGRIYFDTTKTKADIAALFDSLTLEEDQYWIYASKTMPASGEYLCLFKEDEDYIIVRAIFENGQPVSEYYIYDPDGWNPEFEGYYDVNTEVFKISDLSTYGLYQEYQNDKLTSLCWLGTSCYKFKEFDGTEHPFIYDVEVNGESAVVNNEVKLTIGEKLEMAGSKAGQVVPNTGVGGKYRLNIGLNKEEVNTLINTVLTDEVNFLIVDSDDTSVLKVEKDGDEFEIYLTDKSWDDEVFNSTNGWDEDFDGSVDFSGLVLTDSYYTYSSGTKNSELISLLYTDDTPYSYSAKDPNGKLHTFVDDKKIVNSDYTLNNSNVSEIAIGYKTNTYEEINLPISATTGTVVANQTVTTSSQEASLAITSLPAKYCINKVTFDGTNYYIPTENRIPNVYLIGDFNDDLTPIFTKYTFAIMIEVDGSTNVGTLYVQTDGSYSITVVTERPSAGTDDFDTLFKWFDADVWTESDINKHYITIDGKKMLLNVVADYISTKGYLEFYNNLNHSSTEHIVKSVVTGTSTIPAGLYLSGFEDSGEKLIKCVNEDIHKIGSEYLDITSANIPTITITQEQLISLDPIEIQLTNEQAAIMEAEATDTILFDASALNYYKTYARKSICDGNTLIFSFDYNGNIDNEFYIGEIVYNKTNKQGTLYGVDLNYKKMGFRKSFRTAADTLVYELTHPLNSQFLIVQLMDSNFNTVEANITRNATNKVTITFGAQPTVNELYYVLLQKIDYYFS